MADPRPSAAPPSGSSRPGDARSGPPPIANVRPAPVQFSMRSMLIAVTGVAILAALSSYLGWRVTTGLVGYFFAMAASSVAPVCFGTLALYVRGPRQTFFLGAFAGSVIPVFAGSFAFYPAMQEMGILPYALLLAINVVNALAFGWLALATRRAAERRGWTRTRGEGVSESADCPPCPPGPRL
jgi:hypothetical protein